MTHHVHAPAPPAGAEIGAPPGRDPVPPTPRPGPEEPPTPPPAPKPPGGPAAPPAPGPQGPDIET